MPYNVDEEIELLSGHIKRLGKEEEGGFQITFKVARLMMGVLCFCMYVILYYRSCLLMIRSPTHWSLSLEHSKLLRKRRWSATDLSFFYRYRDINLHLYVSRYLPMTKQAYVPSPVPPDPTLIPNQKQSKIQKSNQD